ncbi:MAG: preprotein translocase subunit SecE [Planctomycetota bacterium]
MAYRKDQGRLARMAAFWTLAVLLIYGCVQLRTELTSLFPHSVGHTFGADENREGGIRLPIVGLDLSAALLISVLAAGVGLWLLHRWLEAPKRADLLIDTEHELRKVTWPTLDEAVDGSIVVVVVVLFLMGFMAAADFVLGVVFQRLITGA